MADAPASTSSGSKGGSLGFLGRKIGPVPIWLIGLALVAAWYWYQNYGPGASSSGASSADAVDPATGVPWAEELGEAQQQLADQQTGQQPDTDTTSTGPVEVTGVNRSGRSPKVKHQINEIHKEHQASQDKKHPPARKIPDRRSPATVARPRTAPAPRSTGPARTTTRWRAPETAKKAA